MKKRESNLELLRIVAMLAIIAHHYVVNSGITDLYDFSNVNKNMIFLQLWGAWGKTAINCFVLISGYFMCTSTLTSLKYLKIYFIAKFYKIIIFVILAIGGLQVVSFSSLYNLVFCYLLRADFGFTGSFLVFYLFIPFYNLLLQHLDKDKLKKFVVMLLCFYSIVPTFFPNEGIAEPIEWYMVLYFVAAYIRLYPSEWMRKNKICVPLLVVSIVIAVVSILFMDVIGGEYNFISYYHLIEDSNKFLAFIIGLLLFLSFKNLKIKHSKIINSIAATTFGVLCIHANSDAMRTLIWKYILDVCRKYDDTLLGLAAHAILSMVGIFIICSAIDLLRIRLLEKPILRWIESKNGKFR